MPLASVDSLNRTLLETLAALDALLRIDIVHLLGSAGDGIHRAYFFAQGASDAFVRVDYIVQQSRTDSGGTVLVLDMRYIFIPKVLQRAQNRVRRTLS